MNNDRVYHCKWNDSTIAWTQHRRWEFPLGCVCRLRHSHRHHRTICKYDIWQYTIFHNVQNLEGKGLDSPPSGIHFPVCCLQGLSCFVFWFLLHCCSGNLHNILTTDSMQGFLLEGKTFKGNKNLRFNTFALVRFLAWCSSVPYQGESCFIEDNTRMNWMTHSSLKCCASRFTFVTTNISFLPGLARVWI